MCDTDAELTFTNEMLSKNEAANMKKTIDAEKAIQHVARHAGMTAEEARRQMELAMRAGLCNQDPAVQARWKRIPCRGEVPTPEELIVFLATHADAGLDPFA